MKQYRNSAMALMAAMSLAAVANASQPVLLSQAGTAGDQGKNTPFSADYEATGSEYTVTVERIDVKDPMVIGDIRLQDTPEGLRITPSLQGLPPGEHGFHVHQNAKCSPRLGENKVPGSDAGPHYDPQQTDAHKGPHGDGHLGDLPRLIVDEQGRATQSMLAPRLKLADVAGRSLIIHEGGDNFSDEPKPLGGGGQRIACGIIRN